MTKLKIILIALISIMSTGCQMTDNYKFGDVSKTIAGPLIEQYCLEGNEEVREVLKADLKALGFDLGVDFCFARGFTKAMMANND